MLVGCSCPVWLFVKILHFSYDRSNWSFPSNSTTAFQKFPSISDLLSVVSNFQHHTKLYPKSSNLLVTSLKLGSFCSKKSTFFWMLPFSSQTRVYYIKAVNYHDLLWYCKRQRSPVTGPVWPECSRRSRLPDFHDIRHMRVVRSSASRTGRLYPQ
jgi:hypothetical protein